MNAEMSSATVGARSISMWTARCVDWSFYEVLNNTFIKRNSTATNAENKSLKSERKKKNTI